MADQQITDDPARMIGQAIGDISDKVTLLVHEEIELAKAEVNSKISKLIRGAVVGVSAGFFVLLGVVALVHAAAWGLYSFKFDPWLSFLLTAGLLFILAGVAGLIAVKQFKDPSPVPQMAIEEARKTKEAIGQVSGD